MIRTRRIIKRQTGPGHMKQLRTNFLVSKAGRMINHKLAEPSSHSPASPTSRHIEARFTTRRNHRPGKVRPAVLMWSIGVPITTVLIFFMIRGCNNL